MNKLSWGLMLSHQNVFWYKNLAISLHLIAELAGTIQHGAGWPLSPEAAPAVPSTQIWLRTPRAGFQVHTGKMDRECDQPIHIVISFCWLPGIFYFTQGSFQCVLFLFKEHHTFSMFRGCTNLWSHTTLQRISFINIKKWIQEFLS